MKKIIMTLTAFVGFGLLLAPELKAAEGSTRLEILPLNEENPRLYAVSDLDFGRQKTTAGKTGIAPQADLTVEILDARVTSSAWELQVKWLPLNNGAKKALANATLSVKQGTLTGENPAGITTATMSDNFSNEEFQTVLRSEGGVSHGKVTYTIKKSAIALKFGAKSTAGDYAATNTWRFINAQN